MSKLSISTSSIQLHNRNECVWRLLQWIIRHSDQHISDVLSAGQSDISVCNAHQEKKSVEEEAAAKKNQKQTDQHEQWKEWEWLRWQNHDRNNQLFNHTEKQWWQEIIKEKAKIWWWV